MARPIVHDDIESCGLTFSELQELWLGPCNGGSVFSSTEELRAAWARGRAVVMRLWGSGGRRPQAWWHLDSEAEGLRYPGYFRERSFLYATNMLTSEERILLEREWRAAFDAARGMGARERREHLEHHDVPAELIERWNQKRQRSLRRHSVTLPVALSEEEAAAIK